jgi:hydrogenase maturation factor
MNPHCTPDPVTGRCITCSDEGQEGRVVSLGTDGIAEVEIEGQLQEVAVELLEAVGVGDQVLVHAGVAIARVGG